MTTHKQKILDHYAATGVEVSIRFKNDFSMSSGPAGPGKLKLIDDPRTTDLSNRLEGIYEFTMPVTLQAQGQPPSRRMMPVIFGTDDVLWISTGFLPEETPSIITPRSNGGGIHFPG